jgi:hypothetical protein
MFKPPNPFHPPSFTAPKAFVHKPFSLYTPKELKEEK